MKYSINTLINNFNYEFKRKFNHIILNKFTSINNWVYHINNITNYLILIKNYKNNLYYFYSIYNKCYEFNKIIKSYWFITSNKNISIIKYILLKFYLNNYKQENKII